jgi:hypothetical protein
MPSMPPEYYRSYRRTVKAKRERQAHQAGVNDGVEMCCKLLRELVGEKALTGWEAARLIAKTLSSGRS